MKNILLIFGTRPEAIKMATLVKEFEKYPDKFVTKVCVTAQHREMLDQVLNFFEITPNYDLDIMKENQNLYDLTSTILVLLKDVLIDAKPDYVFVHGDTTTTMAASLASFYFGAKVCHIEAGLRTNNILSPFPEEINRQIASRISEFHFAPTLMSKQNLMKENINQDKIIVTGNTVIDSLMASISKIKNNPPVLSNNILKNIGSDGMILVTGHRRENHGAPFIRICEALKHLAQKNPKISIIYPVHLNPKIVEPASALLKNIPNIKLIKPLDYRDFIWLMNMSKIILTDSGGVQE